MADWAMRSVLKISEILLKYPTFEVVFFIFSCIEQIRNSVDCRVYTKDSNDMNVIELPILHIKYTFCDQNRVK